MKVARNMIDHFSELVRRGTLKHPGVRHVGSSFSLGGIKCSVVLPTADDD